MVDVALPSPGARRDGTAALTVRRLRFEWPDDLDPCWTPRAPELACVANAASLLMPHAEPFVADAVRAVRDELPEGLRAEADAWAAQETAHHGAHRRLNRLLVARQPGLGRVDALAARLVGALRRRCAPGTAVAYAAGFEALAFVAARWVDRRAHDLLRGAHEVPATLFLWHLAEEVEHKSLAYDVHRAVGGRRRTLALGTALALAVMAVVTMAGTLAGLARTGRIWRPTAHARLLAWSVGFAFELLPALLGTLLAGHHPSRLADPAWLPTWLRSYDPATRTMPAWSMDVLGR